MNSDVISEVFRYKNDVFQSDIFVSNIGITYVDVGCRMSDIVDIEIDVDAHLCLIQVGYLCWSRIRVVFAVSYHWATMPPSKCACFQELYLTDKATLNVKLR
jgi:hypothetical protein